MDGWHTFSFPFGFRPVYGQNVSFREGIDDGYFPPSDSMPLTPPRLVDLLQLRGGFKFAIHTLSSSLGRWPVNTAKAIKKPRLPTCFPQMDAINLTLGRL